MYFLGTRGIKEPKPLRHVISAENGPGVHAWAKSQAGRVDSSPEGGERFLPQSVRRVVGR